MISKESEFSKERKTKATRKNDAEKKYGSFASLSFVYKKKKKKQAKNNCKEATKQAVI